MISISSVWSGVILLIVLIAVYLFTKKRQNFSAISTPTPHLNLYATDFTLMAKQGKLDPVIGREEEVRKLIQVLARRSKNNAILIGDPGVGKTAIVEGLAERIASGDVPETLLNKRVLALDVATLMSGTKYRGEFEQRAKKIVQEISASNRSIVLFIDEVQSVVQSQGTEGSVNFSDILKPALSRGDLQMVGATTVEEYNKYIKTDLSLERRFQPIEINEPNQEETLAILQGIKDKYREYHKVEFTDAALQVAVDLSREFVHDRKLPDKAIDAIDEAAAMVKVSHLHKIVPAVLYQAARDKYPEIVEFWKQVQNIDKQIITIQDVGKRQNLINKREELEQQLEKRGVVTVDTADVEKVVKEWSV